MTTLIPCPFCGRKITRHTRSYSDDGWCSELTVYCACGAEVKITSDDAYYADGTTYRFLPTAIDIWNTRNGKKVNPNDDNEGGTND